MRTRFMVIAATLMLGFTSSLAMAADAPAKESGKQTAQDAANIAVVKAFIAGWNESGRGVDQLSDKASIRMEEDKPAIVGKKAYVDGWSAMAPDQRLTVKIHEVIALSPVVLTRRTDTVVTPGKPDMPFEISGVFIVKDGKIVEWTDYLHK
jgi:limonene-1,2-epoxide hydrolase